MAMKAGGATLLVSMPMAAPYHPNLGLALLQGALRRDGWPCDIRHFYLDFADFIGVEAYDTLAEERYFLALAGEWVFRACVGGEQFELDMGYLRSILMSEFAEHMDAKRVQTILATRAKATPFIGRCLQSVDWDRYDIIGFSTSFQQTTASLALAKAIKTNWPTKIVVFGGANCEGEMGREIHRQFPFVDIVVSGEAEVILPEVVRRLVSGKPLLGIAGVTFRGGGQSMYAPEQHVFQDMDSLPRINFDDFIRDRKRFPAVSASYRQVPLFETARGCWWGQKHHCTFCGLNGGTMDYRSKSPARAIAEIQEIAASYGSEMLVVDNILDHRYFDTFVPNLSKITPPLLLHYEVKANLKAEQLVALSRAGIRKIQPGIESLSTSVLKRMRKGTTRLRNVQLLRLAAEAGVFVDWGHLFGFPGETAEDYVPVFEAISKIGHLQPPSGANRVRADRFSPYFNNPADFGISIRPLAAYDYVWGLQPDVIRRLAYHFEIDVDESENVAPLEAYLQLKEAVQQWRQRHHAVSLTSRRIGEKRILVEDRRGDEINAYELKGAEALLLESCGEVRGIARLIEECDEGPHAEEALQRLISLSLLLEEDGEVVALPLRQPGFQRAPEPDVIRNSFGNSYFGKTTSDRQETIAT